MLELEVIDFCISTSSVLRLFLNSVIPVGPSQLRLYVVQLFEKQHAHSVSFKTVVRYNGVEVPNPPLYTEVSLNPEDAHDNLKWSVVLLLRILSPASPNSIDTVGTGGVDGEAQPRILIKIRSDLNYLLKEGLRVEGF